jgi:AhpD family alkylhydroperoxidase
MSARLPYRRLAPELYQKLGELGKAAAVDLDPVLVELVKTRVSQINGCAYCINLHTKALRELGETEQRIYLLDAWRETPLYTERERAALAWAEAVTRLPNGEVPDELFDETRAQFSDTELVQLTYVTAAINSWNRLAIPFRSPVVADRPAPAASATG